MSGQINDEGRSRSQEHGEDRGDDRAVQRIAGAFIEVAFGSGCDWCERSFSWTKGLSIAGASAAIRKTTHYR